MDSSNNELLQARIHAQAQWNANPCGGIPADTYDRAFFEGVAKERYRQQYWQRSFFDFKSFRGGRVLEIGVGIGTDLKQFASNGANCYGVDITDTHLSLTRQNLEADGFTVALHQSDATALPFPNDHFDCVYSFGVIHHIPDVTAVLHEVHRVLKPGGMFQVAVYHLFSIHTLALLLRSIISGRIARLGISGVLSTIEVGADGVVVKPYVKLYSAVTLKRLLRNHNFKILKNGIRQVNFDKSHSLHILRLFERLIGWYVCATVTKIDESALAHDQIHNSRKQL